MNPDPPAYRTYNLKVNTKKNKKEEHVVMNFPGNDKVNFDGSNIIKIESITTAASINPTKWSELANIYGKENSKDDPLLLSYGFEYENAYLGKPVKFDNADKFDYYVLKDESDDTDNTMTACLVDGWYNLKKVRNNCKVLPIEVADQIYNERYKTPLEVSLMVSRRYKNLEKNNIQHDSIPEFIAGEAVEVMTDISSDDSSHTFEDDYDHHTVVDDDDADENDDTNEEDDYHRKCRSHVQFDANIASDYEDSCSSPDEPNSLGSKIDYISDSDDDFNSFDRAVSREDMQPFIIERKRKMEEEVPNSNCESKSKKRKLMERTSETEDRIDTASTENKDGRRIGITAELLSYRLHNKLVTIKELIDDFEIFKPESMEKKYFDEYITELLKSLHPEERIIGGDLYYYLN